MNAVLIAIIVLVVILVVMLCNSNKDGYDRPHYHEILGRLNPDELQDLCWNHLGQCGISVDDCLHLGASAIYKLSPKQKTCLSKLAKRYCKFHGSSHYCTF